MGWNHCRAQLLNRHTHSFQGITLSCKMKQETTVSKNVHPTCAGRSREISLHAWLPACQPAGRPGLMAKASMCDSSVVFGIHCYMCPSTPAKPARARMRFLQRLIGYRFHPRILLQGGTWVTCTFFPHLVCRSVQSKRKRCSTFWPVCVLLAKLLLEPYCFGVPIFW